MTDTDNRQMLPMGALLKGGEYRVTRYIASGGFGNTYEVEHVRLGKRLAMKEFFMRGINVREGNDVTVSVSDNRDAFLQMKDKFFKEAQRLARLQQEHIVEVSDFFEENMTAYYVMKLVEGESLSATMKRTGQPLTEQQVRHVLPQVLQALKCVHRQGIYHLDLKPGNIMQNAEGHCWVIDFGASKQLSAAESQTLSTSTGLCYTPGYAPSEQVEGSMKRIGPWTDLYALGATLYNLLSGERPPELSDVKYDGEKAFHFPPQVSSEMRSLVLWMMQSDYPRRPQSVEEIEQRLAQPSAATVMLEERPVQNISESAPTVAVSSAPKAEMPTAKVQDPAPHASEPVQQSTAYKIVNVLFWMGVVFSLYVLLSIIFPNKSADIWASDEEIHMHYRDIFGLFRGDGKKYYFNEMKETLAVAAIVTSGLYALRRRFQKKGS